MTSLIKSDDANIIIGPLSTVALRMHYKNYISYVLVIVNAVRTSIYAQRVINPPATLTEN